MTSNSIDLITFDHIITTHYMIKICIQKHEDNLGYYIYVLAADHQNHKTFQTCPNGIRTGSRQIKA